MLASPGSSLAGTAQIWDATAGAGPENLVTDADVKTRQSLYVELFQSMQNIVLEHEGFLFSEHELRCLQRLRNLSYPARYLLIRLCLCKRGKWHTLASLEKRYMIEIGDRTRISTAIDELCGIQRSMTEAEVKKEEIDVIDLTMEDEGVEESEDIPLKVSEGPAATVDKDNVPPDRLSAFAADNTAASVPDLLACLQIEDLKTIAKQMKVTRTVQNRSNLIESILSNASQQSTLDFHVLTPCNNSAKFKGDTMRQLTLNFSRDGKKGSQHAIVRRLVSKIIGRCMRIEPAIFALFDRLNLVFFRSTIHSPSLLLPSLLTAFRKRRYGTIGYVRTASIFPSRDALLAYEEALQLEYSVDEILERGDASTLQGSAVQAGSTGKQSQPKGKGKVKVEGSLPAESLRIEGARAVRDIFEKIYDQWKALVCKDEEKVLSLERFECGHVLTRIVYKGAQALAILKDYETEMEVLHALLAQKKWRRGRRGAWYDRLALVLMTHCERTQENLETAMEVVVKGLEDDLTHMTYRPRLQRRLARLESLLRIPKDLRHKCEGKLLKAEDTNVIGVRIYKNRTASIVLDKSGRIKTSATPFLDRSKTRTPFSIARASTQPRERDGQHADSSKGKTIWVGRHGEEVSVEQLALEYYEDQGFKGFHSEGSIVSTIFGLLFWDIIFAPVTGAFETPYQTAPLDVYEDGFYAARADLIKERLKDLEDGRARNIIARIDERERPTKTMCIGVDWKYSREDLMEIVDCLGGHALGIICQTICEDYSHWRGGVPDLLVWNAQTGICKFVEVKSPKDTLSENQKVWIDVLLGSDTLVDVCHVMEKGFAKQKNHRRATKKPAIESSDLEPEEQLESEDENLEMPDGSQSETEERNTNKRACDSDEFIASPRSKKLKVEVVITTPRKRRKG